MNREDFKILETGVIYFDNGATTMKPNQVVNSIVDYYTNYTANAHRGDYDNSLKVDTKYEEVRNKVQTLINCKSTKEVIFTSGTTDSLNMIANGFVKNKLSKGDEILITKAEHSSNFLPWLELEKEIGIVVKYIPLDENNTVTIENVEKTITEKTKVIALAHVTNVLGDKRPIKEIGKLCQNKNIYLIVDGAQSVPHIKVDVEDLNIDFLAFSGHKMLGPTGVGVLYGKLELLEQLKPTTVGGGMNVSFNSNSEFTYRELPTRLEAGTPNIEGVIGLGAAIDYLLNIGMDKIESHELELKNYLIQKLENVPNILIHNKNIESSILAFNVENVFAQDIAVYLNHYHICVRAGNHCAKALEEELKVKNTCRISFYLYNTKEEIDVLVEALTKQEDIFKYII